jgi:hypothetical protein
MSHARVIGVWAALMLIIGLSVGFCVVLAMAVFPSVPVVYEGSRTLTSTAPPGGRFIAEYRGASRVGPDCLQGRSSHLDVAGGSHMSVRGDRSTVGDGHIVVRYDIDIPRDAPEGPAQFWVRETYGCGVQTVVDTPKLTFEIARIAK